MPPPPPGREGRRGLILLVRPAGRVLIRGGGAGQRPQGFLQAADHHTGIQRLGQVRIEPCGVRPLAVLGAAEGGQCQGQHAGPVALLLQGAHALDELIAVFAGHGDVRDQGMGQLAGGAVGQVVVGAARLAEAQQFGAVILEDQPEGFTPVIVILDDHDAVACQRGARRCRPSGPCDRARRAVLLGKGDQGARQRDGESRALSRTCAVHPDLAAMQGDELMGQ